MNNQELKFYHFYKLSDFLSKKISENSSNTAYIDPTTNEVIKGTPEISWQSIVYIDDSKQQWTHGTFYSGKEVKEASLIKGTHAEIFELYKNSKLIPGSRYAITDYECSYIHPSSGNDEVFEVTQPADDVEYLILEAVDVNRFDENIEYVRKDGYVKIRECKYSIDPDTCSYTRGMSTPAKGVVYYMKDDFENECSYDFKHVKYRRYAILDITPNLDKNDGTGGYAGPYKCCETDTSYVFNDSRCVIGSGDNWDKEFIPALFNGKWGHLLSYRCDMAPYTDEYVKMHIKPYQNENYPWDKYLSWQKNMREKNGLSEAVSQGPCSTYGQCVVEIDKDDYRDRYTFDYNGDDASELMAYGVSQPLVKNSCVLNTFCGTRYPDQEVLPNTIIAISESCINNSQTRVQSTKIISDEGGNTTQNSKNNTILLKNYPGQAYGYIVNTEFIDGGTNLGFSKNLFIVGIAAQIKICGCANNFIVGDLNSFRITGYFRRNVMFGYYNCIDGITSTDNLFYSSFANVIFETDEGDKKTYHSAKDGSYWYDTVFRDWFSYNILAPHQYASFKPHFNTNTMRGGYNKGVDYGPTLQTCSFGRNVWGTNISYGSIQGGIRMGDLIRTTVAPAAFKQIYKLYTSGCEYMVQDQPRVPNMTDCDVKSYNGDPRTIITDLTETQLNILEKGNGGKRSILMTKSDGKWTLVDYEGNTIE